MPTILSRRLWGGSADIYARILDHPFVTGLADGSLPPETFRHYLEQDSLYLQDYARALRALASHAPTTAVATMFEQHANNAVAAETALHADILAELGAAPTVTERSPTTLAYTSYLMATVRGGSFEEGLAAVLPCYWLYWEVGRELAGRSSPNPLFARWIKTYGGAEFGEITKSVLAVVDELDVSSSDVARMTEHFRVGARYEWMFWDAAHRREGWPV